MSSKDLRIPRPFGITSALIQYNNSQDSELLGKIQTLLIQQWLINNQTLCGRNMGILELSNFLKCNPEKIRLQMRDQLLGTKIWDKGAQEELIAALIGQQVTWALEDRMAVEGQYRALKQSQGDKYTPFVTSEVNHVLGLKLQSTGNLASILKSINGGGSINIFNQQNVEDNTVTMEQVIDIISKDNNQILESKQVQYIEAHYDTKDEEKFPEVVANRQVGVDTSKEGLSMALSTGEIEQITDNYKGILNEFNQHENRRARELGIDEAEIDPEFSPE